jgi:MFS family permease
MRVDSERTPISPNVSFARARVAAALMFAADGIAFSTWAASIPRIAEALRLSPGSVAIATFSFSLGAVATMPFSGRLADRYGAHRLAVVAGATIVPILPLFVEARSFALLIALALVCGAVLGALDVGSNAYAVAAETAENGAWMSQMHGIWSVGNVAGSLLIATLVGAHVEYPSLAGALGIGIATACAFRFAVALEHRPSERHSHARTMTLVVLGALAAFGLLVEGSMSDWGALYLRRNLHASETLAPVGYAVFAGAMMATRFVGDAVVRRVGRASTLSVSAAIAASALALALTCRSTLPAIVAFAFVGIGCANLAPTVFGSAGRIAAGSGVATVITIGLSGFLVGPAAIGGLAQRAGLGVALWIVVGCALVIAAASLVPKLREVVGDRAIV